MYVECPANLITRNTEQFVFSNTPLSFNEAQEKYRLFGGEIAIISSQEDKDFFWPYFKSSLLQGKFIQWFSLILNNCTFCAFKSNIKQISVRFCGEIAVIHS